MKKDHVRNMVLHAVIAAEVAKGHLKWKVSDIARFTKVSRPLIYYHFGRTKKSILKECLNILAEDYYGLSADHANQFEKPEGILQSLMRMKGIFNSHPSLAVLFQRARMHESFVKFQLVEMEFRYQQKLKRSFPGLSEDQIKGIHALFHGMSTAPFLSSSGLAVTLELVRLPALRRGGS